MSKYLGSVSGCQNLILPPILFIRPISRYAFSDARPLITLIVHNKKFLKKMIDNIHNKTNQIKSHLSMIQFID